MASRALAALFRPPLTLAVALISSCFLAQRFN